MSYINLKPLFHITNYSFLAKEKRNKSKFKLLKSRFLQNWPDHTIKRQLYLQSNFILSESSILHKTIFFGFMSMLPAQNIRSSSVKYLPKMMDRNSSISKYMHILRKKIIGVAEKNWSTQNYMKPVVWSTRIILPKSCLKRAIYMHFLVSSFHAGW